MDSLSAPITALKLCISACVSNMIVHLVQGHFNATVEKAVHCAVYANVFTVLRKVPSQYLAAERVVWTFNRQEWAHLVVFVNFTSFYDLLAQLIWALY